MLTDLHMAARLCANGRPPATAVCPGRNRKKFNYIFSGKDIILYIREARKYMKTEKFNVAKRVVIFLMRTNLSKKWEGR
jgi:hypothetical protein